MHRRSRKGIQLHGGARVYAYVTGVTIPSTVVKRVGKNEYLTCETLLTNSSSENPKT